jgi:hypothetical protein
MTLPWMAERIQRRAISKILLASLAARSKGLEHLSAPTL